MFEAEKQAWDAAVERGLKEPTHCGVCGADIRPLCHVRWQEGAWCYDCVEIVRVKGRTTVQARF